MKKQKDEFLAQRGALVNPSNRFLKQEMGEFYDDIPDIHTLKKKTQFIEIFPKTIVNKVTSPDLGMEYSLNPYQGCEHGCTYCYARPTHEYWGYSPGKDFEDTILVKKNAPELLEETLRKKSWRVAPVVLSGNTDCYQPCEREFQITRALLKVFLKFKHPVSIITKNALVTRDIDLLKKLAEHNLISVQISITTLQEELRRKLEPRTSTVAKKLEAIRLLSEAGIPVNVFFAPVIPGLNEHEAFELAKTVKKNGARNLYYQLVRLAGPNGIIFTDWLEKYFPDRKDKVVNIIKDIRGGKLNDSRFGTRMKGEGNYAALIKKQLEVARNRYFENQSFPKLNCESFTIPNDTNQLSLF